MPRAEAMKNRPGAGRRLKLRSNRATPALLRRACRAILSSVVLTKEEAAAAKGDAATAGQMTPNRCFWSKRPANGENPNPALSQCVAVSRSDKIMIRAGRHRPFVASLHPGAFAFLPHSLGLKNQSQSNPIKVNQSDSVGQAGDPNRM